MPSQSASGEADHGVPVACASCNLDFQSALGLRGVHQADLAAGWGTVELPHALEWKYRNAAREWAWQWLFP